MAERIIKGVDVMRAERVLADWGGSGIGFTPINRKQGEYRGATEEIAYKVVMPYGSIRRLLLGDGHVAEPVIATFSSYLRGGEYSKLELVGSRRVLRYINKQIKATRQKELKLSPSPSH